MHNARHKGFSLVDLMMALLIMSVIAAITLPAYTNQVRKSRRSDCQAVLLSLGQSMERFYAANYTYLGAADAGEDTGTPDASLHPSTCPVDGDRVFYNLTIQAAGANSYTLRATPVNEQAGDGILEINSLGQRFRDNNNNGLVTDSGENDWES